MVVVLEEVGERDAAIRGGRARAVRPQAVDVEVVRHVERAEGVAPRVEAEGVPLGGRGPPRVVARLVHERRRDVGERLEAEDVRRLARVAQGVGADVDAMLPVVAQPGADHLDVADARVGVVADGLVDVVDGAGDRRLHELAGGDVAAEVARRQARKAHVGRERDRRDDHERQKAQDDQECRTFLHFLSSAVSR